MLSRGQLIKQLNQQFKDDGINYEAFKRWHQNAYQGYLLGKAYQTYDYLMQAYSDLDPKELAIYPNGKVFGSINLQSLTELVTQLLNQKINPVYYLSSIFNHTKYLVEQGHKYKTPKIKNLQGDYKWYQNQLKYDHQWFDTGNTRQHKTILWNLNPLIDFISNYFDRILAGINLHDSYLKDYQAINLNSYEQMISQDFFPYPYNQKPLQEDLKTDLSNFNHSKDNYTNQQLKRAQQALNARYKGVVPFTASKAIFNAYFLQNITTLIPDDIKSIIQGEADPDIAKALLITNYGLANQMNSDLSAPQYVQNFWYTFTSYETILDLRKSFLTSINLDIE